MITRISNLLGSSKFIWWVMVVMYLIMVCIGGWNIYTDNIDTQSYCLLLAVGVIIGVSEITTSKENKNEN